MDESDVEHSKASASRARVKGEEKRILVQALDASRPKEHCMDEGHRAEAYRARESALECYC